MQILRVLAISAVLLTTFNPVVQGQSLSGPVEKTRDMVVTANPLATAAGVSVLRRGGTAADAMVAVQTVLSLVEPQSSGIGGGAFIVYYDARTKKTVTIDAREKAPAAAAENRFEGLGFFDAWQSGLSVGVPGVPRMMEYMHVEYGKLPWKSLFWRARKLAREGYPLTERTSDQVAGLLNLNPNCQDRLFFRDPIAFSYFAQPNCEAKPAGTIIVNSNYDATLRKLQNQGADGFYKGTIARDISRAVRVDKNIAGDMTMADLANYDIVVRDPVCIKYRGRNVCGMGPPSSGALAVGQILGILENFDLSSGKPLQRKTVHLFTQAGRLAFADRGQYVGDPDFVSVPVKGMLNKGYLESRARMITGRDMGTALPGVPPGASKSHAPHNSATDSGTSHVSIIDQYGNALSMTTTIESSFGNGVMVHGFLLNNQLTDFSFEATDDNGVPIANRVQANKRPRSSMSPTIVFNKKGNVEIVTGSPGGSRIIGYTAQSIINMIDFKRNPQAAINIPHYLNRNGTTDIEEPIPGVTWSYNAEQLAIGLRRLGHSNPDLPFKDRVVNIRSLTSGLSIIQVQFKRLNPASNGRPKFQKVLVGGADKRRDGAVGGNNG